MRSLARSALLLPCPFVLAQEPAPPVPPAPAGLRCELQTDPVAVGTRTPRLSWRLDDPAPGARQGAWQVHVATTAERLAGGDPDLWDSGRIASDANAATYAGRALASRQRAIWRVRVFDERGTASAWSADARFAVALLEPGDWTARWIEDPAPVAPFVPPHNGFHSEFAPRADVPHQVRIELDAAHRLDAVRLHPARPFDWREDAPGFLFPLRFRILAGDSVVFDGTGADVASPGTQALELRFPPVTAQTVTLAVTHRRARAPGEFGVALAELEVMAGERNVARGARVVASDAIESSGSGWSRSRLVDGDRVAHRGRGDEALPPPFFKKTFRLESVPERATLRIGVLGWYRAFLNDEPLDLATDLLSPDWTDYRRRVQYDSIPAAAALRAGENVLEIQLADGWYAGRLGMAATLVPGGPRRGIYGRKPKLIAQLELGRGDALETIVTDESWQVTTEGHVRSADLLDGETQDKRRTFAGVAADAWRPCAIAAAVTAVLEPRRTPPVGAVQRGLQPVATTEPAPGVYVFDFGQNLVGHCRLRTRAPAGTEVTLHHGEMLGDDGLVYRANLRGAPAVDRVTLSADDGTFWPHFTYHGFRFVEVRGLTEPPGPSALRADVVHTDAALRGTFACSDPLLNQIWSNARWSLRGNLMSVPTDCPQRDERLGWMGDILVFAQTAMFMGDLQSFWTKWLQDVRDAQADDGRFPDFAPHPYGKNERFTGTPGWGDAGVFVPWLAWVNYADRELLAAHYPAMTRWIEWIRGNNPDLIWRKSRGNDYGDWLNGDTLKSEGYPKSGAAMPGEQFGTAFFARSTEYVARAAAVLGHGEDARKYDELAAAIRAAFVREYVADDGRLKGDTQAGYALALHFELLPEALQTKAVAHLVRRIEEYGGRLATGFHSTHAMLLELSRHGQHDLACRLVQSREFPSWGYMIEQGATTMWERWDGFMPKRGLQSTDMNSFNHYAFGAVGEWFVRCLLGLEPDEQHPGWKRFTIRPRPAGGITSCKGSHPTPHGTIQVEWKIADKQLVLDVVVPPNTSAQITLPGRERVLEATSGPHHIVYELPR